MKKKPQHKNPHAVALGRLGGLVCSEAKKRANKITSSWAAQKIIREIIPGTHGLLGNGLYHFALAWIILPSRQARSGWIGDNPPRR